MADSNAPQDIHTSQSSSHGQSAQNPENHNTSTGPNATIAHQNNLNSVIQACQNFLTTLQSSLLPNTPSTLPPLMATPLVQTVPTPPNPRMIGPSRSFSLVPGPTQVAPKRQLQYSTIPSDETRRRRRRRGEMEDTASSATAKPNKHPAQTGGHHTKTNSKRCPEPKGQPSIPDNIKTTAGDEDGDDPLAPHVRQYAAASAVKLPREQYNGTGNPIEHLNLVRAYIRYQTQADEALTQLFPLTLTGPARAWFYSLPAGSIQNFAQIKAAFKARFVTSIPVQKSSASLFSLTRAPGEVLRAYVNRFNNEIALTPNVNIDTAEEAIKRNCNCPELAASLIKKPAKTLNDLRLRMNKYVLVEDAKITTTSPRPRQSKNGKKDRWKEGILFPDGKICKESR